MATDPAISRRNFLFARFPRAREEAPSTPVALVTSERPERPPEPAARAALLPILRPPGAVEESVFLARCTRCDDCARACPHGAIVRASERLRGAAGTPTLDPAAAPCHLCPDKHCITACATGALSGQIPVKLGTARIAPTTCLAHQGSFCSTCSERCPVPGAVLVTNGRPRIDASACVGCGLCVHHCPAPWNAIALMPAMQRPLRPEVASR